MDFSSPVLISTISIAIRLFCDVKGTKANYEVMEQLTNCVVFPMMGMIYNQMQIKDDQNPSTERYQITKDTAFDLAALALQADMGDYYDRTGNQYFDPYSYVPPDVSPSFEYR